LKIVVVRRRRRGWRFLTIFANALWGRWWKAVCRATRRPSVFGVSIASAVRWVARFKAKGEISPAPTGGDRRSGRIEAHRDYLLGLIRRRPDMTLLEIQERLIANCGERFSSSVLWRFFDRHEITFKKSPRMPRSSNARTL
jgi:transposase